MCKCVVTDGREKKQNSLSIMKRDVTGDTRVQRNSLLGVASPAALASGEVLDCAMAEGHVWVHDYATAGVSVDVPGSYYH